MGHPGYLCWPTSPPCLCLLSHHALFPCLRLCDLIAAHTCGRMLAVQHTSLGGPYGACLTSLKWEYLLFTKCLTPFLCCKPLPPYGQGTDRGKISCKKQSSLCRYTGDRTKAASGWILCHIFLTRGCFSRPTKKSNSLWRATRGSREEHLNSPECGSGQKRWVSLDDSPSVQLGTDLCLEEGDVAAEPAIC